MENFEKLKTRLAEVLHVNHAAALLGWDQQTYMPPGGAAARAEQLATLSKIAHATFTADETGKLIEAAEAETKDLPYDSDEAAMVRVARHDYDLETKLPSQLVQDTARETTLAHEIWAKAREEADFDQFAPKLERILDLMRQRAEALGYDDRIYDALLDQYEPHMKTAKVEELFSGLREDLVPFVAQIFDRLDAVDASPVHLTYDVDKQTEFGLRVIKALGYDMQRGRQDRAVHPFTTMFSRDDVRITTRYIANYLPAALFGSIHEAGHAMYEQGSAPSLEGTILVGGTSLGVHESQSRLWENIVGRSLGFWQHFYPDLKATFPEQLGSTSLEDFYRAINHVSRSLVRVEADEVTYNLHIMLRFEMENALLEGKLAVKDAPDAWNSKMESYLGITPPDNGKEGILQDVHWSSGLFGYFPTYSLGNFLSVQYWDKALEQEPSIPSDIEKGEFSTLLTWLQDNIYVHGRKFWPAEITKRVSGEEIQTQSFMRYIKAKYAPIYDL